MDFEKLSAYKKLQELAKNPPDLTKNSVFNIDRIKNFVAKSKDYTLFYAGERVNEDIIKTLFELAKEASALEKMQNMQNGEIVNFIRGYPSENRAALHTATRDFFSGDKKSKTANEAKALAYAEYEKLKRFLAEIESFDRFQDLIMIGIGGSDLGPYANFLALAHLIKKGRRAFFINNIDPDNLHRVIESANLDKTLVAVVSKSGNTLETMTNEAFLRDCFVKAGLDPRKHFVAVTGEGSPMDDKSLYLDTFYIWDWIGGRFSSTSMVGGVLLGFAFGMEIFTEFLKGASEMDHAALNLNLSENIPLLGALLSIWNRNFLHYETLAVIPYSQALSRFPAHFQQLSMESNGKHIDKEGKRTPFQTGMIIWGEPGTNAQHSFFQLLHQGVDPIPIEFIGFIESQSRFDYIFNGTTSQEKLLSNLLAQSISLATGKKSDNPNKEFDGNRPSHILMAEQLTPKTLGELLAYFEHKTAFEGFIWNINSFDQEGVQLGKVVAEKIIDQFASQRKKEVNEGYGLAKAYLELFKKV